MLLEKYEKLKLSAITIKTHVRQLYESATDLKSQYQDKTETLKKEKKAFAIQGASIDTLKEILDKMSYEHIERIVDLLTYALSVIFYDKDYSVEVVTGDKRNAKTAEFVLVERGAPDSEFPNMIMRSPFDDGVGGGVVAVVGLILQVYYIGMFELSPILIADEAFSQVSAEYLGPLLDFIEELAIKKDFIIALISHDERIIEKSKRTYRINDGIITLVK